MSRLRLASQLISASGPAHRSPVDVVRWMAAMQAQDFLAAKWAVGLRLPGSTDAEVEGALADATIVRSWPMRGTLHLVAAEDLRWMLSLSRDRMVQRASSIHAAEGLTPTVLERLSNTTVETLQGGHAFSRDEMGSIFEREGISALGQARYHALWWLSQTGTLCLGPPRAGARAPGPRRA